MIYPLAMAMARQQLHRTLPRFTPDPPHRTWMEPCACSDPWVDHPRLWREQGPEAYLSHMQAIYKHGWRYGKGRTTPVEHVV